MQQQPSALDGQLKASGVFGRAAFELVQEWPVDLFDMDTAFLRGFDRVGDLDQLASGLLRIGVGRGRISQQSILKRQDQFRPGVADIANVVVDLPNFDPIIRARSQQR